MGKLTDVAIRYWINAGERFEGRTDGDGLVLTWRPDRTTPHWRLRYRFAGKSRVMNLGSYTVSGKQPAFLPTRRSRASPSAGVARRSAASTAVA